jgi:transcriptional regulator with XRE-family HTH domain
MDAPENIGSSETNNSIAKSAVCQAKSEIWSAKLVKALCEHEMRLTANCRFGKNRGMNRRKIEPVAMLSCRRFLEKLERLIPPTQQKTYEERAEIPKGKITKWRRGEQHIRLEEAWRLARELGVSLEFLADDTQDEEAKPGLTTDQQQILDLVDVLMEKGASKKDIIRRLSQASVDLLPTTAKSSKPENEGPAPSGKHNSKPNHN